MTTSISRGRRRLATLGLALGLVAGAVTGGAPGAGAQTNPYERGPAPTVQSIEASRGSYATSQTTVSSLSASGFGGGTIYYPTTTADGTFGAVAISPGFTAGQSSIAWLGPRIASQGFVVITIDTNSRFDQPASRGSQLLAALDYLTQRSSVRTRIDPPGWRWPATPWVAAARSRRRPTAPRCRPPSRSSRGTPTSRGPRSATPTLIIGAQNDTVASVTSHSEPFYNSIPASAEKAYMELRGASHFVSNSSNTPTARQMIAWLKRYVDNDTRYEQFICPPPGGTAISEYRNTCPG